MGFPKVDVHELLRKSRTNLFFDDFNWFVDAQMWTKFATSVGGEAVANSDGDGGLMTLTTGATLNNAVGLGSTRKLWTFGSMKPSAAQIEFKYTDADTDKMGFAFGFNSTWGATTLADTTFLPASSFSGCMVYKKPGDTTWSLVLSVGTDQTIVATSIPCQGIAAGYNQRFVIDLTIVNSFIEATFWIGAPQGIGGTQVNASVQGLAGGSVVGGEMPAVYTALGIGGMLPGRQIKLTKAYAGAVAMTLGCAAKAGSAASQVAYVDLMGVDYLARP